MSQVETPDYTIEKQLGDIEIRRYPAQIVAETTAKGERMDAVSDGFSPLADFIFGKNAPNRKIAMTAPVVQTQDSGETEGQKIAMTAPVTQTAAGERWKVQFIMPKEYKLSDLPAPQNPNVRLREEPAKRVAAIRFNGRATPDNVRKHEAALKAFMAAESLSPASDTPVYAYYNPPWTLPYFRRNEVMFILK